MANVVGGAVAIAVVDRCHEWYASPNNVKWHVLLDLTVEFDKVNLIRSKEIQLRFCQGRS